MATDITHEHELEGQLKRTQDFYESLVRNAATGILALDVSGKLRIANPPAHALLNPEPRHSPSLSRLRGGTATGVLRLRH
jgi:PAS domain-containing protein